MKNFINNLLAGFEYDGIGSFMWSLCPTIKYDMAFLMVFLSVPLALVEQVFGLDYMAVGGLLLVMLLELASGTYASHISKQEFSSRKLSRFTFKSACYLVLISVPYLFYTSFNRHGSTLAASIFEWLHLFLVVQIVLENIFSILENMAVIQGKPKTFWIDKIKGKINGMV